MVAPGSPPLDSLPSAFRASDEEREDVIRVLRDGSVAGRLSNDTFQRRVERALRARRVDELAGLLRDLPATADEDTDPGSVGRLWSRFADRIRAAWFHTAWRTARLPRLVLPRGPRTVFTIGRSPDCDLPLGDITVSWHHAELRRSGHAWVLVDLGSTNGTRVNGWRADAGFTVRAGDWVSFGAAAYRLADPA
jgi:FHA domain-containing protein/uncharacterized protein DUF1707